MNRFDSIVAKGEIDECCTGRASALGAGGCGFDPWPGHTKD